MFTFSFGNYFIVQSGTSLPCLLYVILFLAYVHCNQFEIFNFFLTLFHILILILSFASYSFNSASRIITNVMEGQSVRLLVDRKQGLHGTVRVDWSCGNAASSDLTPWAGTLVFAEV